VTPLTQPGANVPGFRRSPGEDDAGWDWSADVHQRWWVDAIRARVERPVFAPSRRSTSQ